MLLVLLSFWQEKTPQVMALRSPKAPRAPEILPAACRGKRPAKGGTGEALLSDFPAGSERVASVARPQREDCPRNARDGVSAAQTPTNASKGSPALESAETFQSSAREGQKARTRGVEANGECRCAAGANVTAKTASDSWPEEK